MALKARLQMYRTWIHLFNEMNLIVHFGKRFSLSNRLHSLCSAAFISLMLPSKVRTPHGLLFLLEANFLI